MDRLLKKLSTISEIHHPGTFEQLKLKNLCEEVVSKFESRLLRNQIHVQLNCPQNIEIKSIKFLVETILYNVIENAINFKSLDSSVDKMISIDVFEQEAELVIEIQDNGIGIEDYMLPKIYDMFFIGTEHSNGNGLGLYIVNKAITVLKGSISISSEKNAFTKAMIVLPIDDSKGHALDFIS